MTDYPYLGGVGLWKTSHRAEACYACHQEIPPGVIYFAFGAEGSKNPAIPPGGTPYHTDCALYVFSNGDKPPQLFAYPQTREQLAIVLPEPAFAGVPGAWRSARRAWVCRHCAGLIRVGERYYDYIGEAHSYESGRPYHRACAIEVWSPTATDPQAPPAVPPEKMGSEES